VGCVQACVSEWSLSTLHNPISKLQHAPLPLKMLWNRECAPTPPFFAIFYLDSHLSPSRSWECVKLPIGILYGVKWKCEYTSRTLFLNWMDGWICRLYGPNWLPNSMPLNLFWIIRIHNFCFYNWSINVFATFYNSACLAMFALVWKGTKGQSMMECLLPHRMHKLWK
jgi:hypothetical protein